MNMDKCDANKKYIVITISLNRKRRCCWVTTLLLRVSDIRLSDDHWSSTCHIITCGIIRKSCVCCHM